jgi:hypothetical protein
LSFGSTAASLTLPWPLIAQEEGESQPGTRRSRTGLSDDPSLCAAPYTAGGVGELHQRVSPFMESFCCADHHPMRTGDERERLVAASPVIP